MSGKIGKLGVWAGLGLAAICAAQEVGDMDEHQKPEVLVVPVPVLPKF
jgi:hypothetical protein